MNMSKKQYKEGRPVSLSYIGHTKRDLMGAPRAMGSLEPPATAVSTAQK